MSVVEGSVTLPMFSINFGIRNTTTSMKPSIIPIGLFKRDIMEKGSLICKIIRKKLSYIELHKRCKSWNLKVNTLQPHNTALLLKARKQAHSDVFYSPSALPEPFQGFWHWYQHEPGIWGRKLCCKFFMTFQSLMQ